MKIFFFWITIKVPKKIIKKENQKLNNSFFKQIKSSLVSDKLKNIQKNFYQCLDAKTF